MDPFKLLSRSTNLHKPNSSQGVKVHHIPSAANSGHLERQSRNDVDHDTRANRGRKRKRSTGDSHQSLQVLQKTEVDDTPNDIANISCLGHTFVNPTTTSDQQEEPSEAGKSADTFNRDEWRTVLKQNRVKVMLLEAGSRDADVRKHRHKRLSRRVDGGDPRTNKAHLQLTSRPLQSLNHLVTKYNVSKRLGLNLETQGYTTPTEVQLGTIPILLGTDNDRGLQLEDKKGHKIGCRSDIDLLTVAPTGSGKTLAFLIHLLHGLREHHRQKKNRGKIEIKRRPPQALILAPTHELVNQIVIEGKKLASGTGIRISRMRKGMKHGSDSLTEGANGKEDTLEMPVSDYLDNRLQKSSMVTADILVSTPMLLLHATAPSPETSLADIRYLVLDEADVLLDPLFRQQTLDIWNLCTNTNLQTSLWSATIGSSIENLAQGFILDRRRKLDLAVGHPEHHIIRLVVGLKDSAVPNISHRLVYAATERGKLMALRQLIHPTATGNSNAPPLQPPFLMFTQTIPRAVALHAELLYDVPVEAGGSSRIAVLHSDLSDKRRSAIMVGFRKGEIWILITTDLLARGVDFRGVNGVVNYDIPNTSGIYVHRVGRTGRQGRDGGVAVTLYTQEDIKYVKNVANVIAASERQRGKGRDAGEDDGLQEWLLNALPDVSKKTKRELKKKGVEARRTTTNSDDGGKTARRMRISTKSGYDRKLEHNRKGAVVGSRHQSVREGSDEEWDGIED
ncbi:MAG: hypothetical protein Q9225_000858 [Loekoesia sp. 1 TL-2023]